MAAVTQVRKAEYAIVFTDISAQDVPNSDAHAGMSDPYATFALQECDGSYDELHQLQLGGATQPIRNAQDPAWSDEVVTLWSPAGSSSSLIAASAEQEPALWTSVAQLLTPSEKACLALEGPLVRVRIYDLDIEEASTGDQLLAEATLRLDPGLQGQVQKFTLSGCGAFAPCTVYFAWHMRVYVPPPPAMLSLRRLSVEGLPVEPGKPPHERLYGAQTASTVPKKGHCFTDPKASAPATMLLRVTLLEVGRRMAQPVQVSAHATTLGADFYLPKGARRPPLIQAQLLDSKAPSPEEKQPQPSHNSPGGKAGKAGPKVIASIKIRLAPKDGDVEAKLPYVVKGKDGRNKLKSVCLRFAHTTTDLPGEELYGRLSRVGALA